ncbi:MAG: hypothetical protein K5839_07960, partial [Treponemataceae bacterium]|nr:hypothetical protein [Treponemataceae bacterium]
DPFAGLSDLGDTAAEAESNDDPFAGLGDVSSESTTDEAGSDDNAFTGLDDLESPETESSTEEDPLAGLSDLGDTDTETESNDDPFAGLSDLGDTAAEAESNDDPFAGLGDVSSESTTDEVGSDDNAFAGLDDLESPDTESSTEEDPFAGLGEDSSDISLDAVSSDVDFDTSDDNPFGDLDSLNMDGDSSSDPENMDLPEEVESLESAGPDSDLEDFNMDDFSTTDEKLEGGEENLDSIDDFVIPGFSNSDGSDFEYDDGPKSGAEEAATEDEYAARTSLTPQEYEKFKKNLKKYPLNLRIEIEKVITDDSYKDDAIFDLIEKILKGSTARQVASHMGKFLDIEVSVPRDFERRTAEQYASYKKSLEYQLKNRILPFTVVAVVLGFIVWGLAVFTAKFIYRPMVAEQNYKAGYELLQNNMYAQSEMKFNTAVSYKPKKEWYMKYARGYCDKKQYERSRAMYERTLKAFNHDKAAGIEWANMELYELYNYTRAEELVRREILDYHINDADAMALLGDVYLEWASEKDPSKFDDALAAYNDVNLMYGPNVEYEKRFMRYYIRTDDLKSVLLYKQYFYTGDAKKDKKNKKALNSKDLIELSEYLLDKLYGPLPPNKEYLRSQIENVRQLLDMAVQADPSVPEASYNLARYFLKTGNDNNAEILLKQSIELFDNAEERKPKRIQKNIDAYRLLGEVYTGQQQYLLSEETYGKGIRLFEEEQQNSFLKATPDIGKLYSDIADLDYFISGNTDVALINYQNAIKNGYDTPSVNYRVGYIQYANKDYGQAMKSFLKTEHEEYEDKNVMFALGNVLSFRNDDYSSQGYYQRLIEQLDLERARRGILMPQIQGSDGELVEMYMKASNNLGVVLHRLANRIGDSQLNSEAMVLFSESVRAWDALTRNQTTMVRVDGSNLASMNLKYVSHPYSDFEPSIYTSIPRVLEGEKVLEQTFVK